MTQKAVLARRTLLYGAAASCSALLLGSCAGDEKPVPRRTSGRRPKRPSTGFVPVPGARLYYEVHGSGPTLLMIHAGSGETSSWGGVVPILARHYRVITYDRRGNSRSTVDGPPKDAPPAVQADDAHHLLRELGGEPAHVLGSSAGAIIALDLATRYPGRLRTVVAHEPPVFEVLPDPKPYRALANDVYDIYRREGVEAAFIKFIGGVNGRPGEEGTESEPGAVLTPDPEAQKRSAGNNEFFIAHEMRAFLGYRPDLAALKASPARIVIGVGRTRDEDLVPLARTAAERMGKDLAEFPGTHTGYATHPKAFAAKLTDVLAGK